MDNSKSFLFAVVIVIIIVIFLLYLNKTEYFDTYFNHDIGAAEILNKPVKQASEWAKYHWNDRDRDGYSIYDKYYTRLMDEKNQNSIYDYNNYSKQDIENFADPKPVYTTFRGEKIFLSQKNF